MPNSSPPRTPHTPLRRARPGTPAPPHGTLPAARAAYDRTVPAALALLRRVRPAPRAARDRARPVPLAVLRRALASRPVPAGRGAPRPWPADTRLRRVGAWPWPAGTRSSESRRPTPGASISMAGVTVMGSA
ncbi:hypothetical protein AB0A67_28865, partial [Streptomyces eurythermus]